MYIKYSLLQDKLNQFSDWVAGLGISLNLSMRHVFTFFRSRLPIHNKYNINSTLHQHVSSIKYLGIHYFSTLCLSPHIESTVGRSLKVIGLIKCDTKHFSSAIYLRSLYTSLLRSLLEHGVIIWNPNLTKYQLRLECVHNKFLAYTAFVLKLPDPGHEYTYLREVINIQSLHFRRIIADQNCIMALLNGLLDAPDILSNISFRIPSYNTY